MVLHLMNYPIKKKKQNVNIKENQNNFSYLQQYCDAENDNVKKGGYKEIMQR